ncbi:hypothetical protein [Streptomyces sp. NBC_01264]|uniref:hypothetical protein n=1 Tax=Streptomyces sp. NBC_01264 TaxID=2903804 RepID=UPI002253A0BF|nr:hypothetical protein [Streptomyces sp. NBC_01264]MCX4779214.1 hypothetical protein [Streptomyces sp. NBC_01264]
MLNEALTAIAAAGGTAVVQAIGTDVWMLVRGRVGVLLGRGDATREQAVLTRLDRTAGELEQAPDGHVAIHARLEDSWRTRFEDFLDELPPEAQNEALQGLRDVVALGGLGRGSTSAGQQGLAVGGDLQVQAQHGSVAGGVLNVEGGLHMELPQQPAADLG